MSVALGAALCAGQGMSDAEVYRATAGLPSRFPRGFMRGFAAGYESGSVEGKERDRAGQTASRGVGAVPWTQASPVGGASGSTEEKKLAAGTKAADEQIGVLQADYESALNILRSKAPKTAAMQPTGAEVKAQLESAAGWSEGG